MLAMQQQIIDLEAMMEVVLAKLDDALLRTSCSPLFKGEPVEAQCASMRTCPFSPEQAEARSHLAAPPPGLSVGCAQSRSVFVKTAADQPEDELGQGVHEPEVEESPTKADTEQEALPVGKTGHASMKKSVAAMNAKLMAVAPQPAEATAQQEQVQEQQLLQSIRSLRDKIDRQAVAKHDAANRKAVAESLIKAAALRHTEECKSGAATPKGKRKVKDKGQGHDTNAGLLDFACSTIRHRRVTGGVHNLHAAWDEIARKAITMDLDVIRNQATDDLGISHDDWARAWSEWFDKLTDRVTEIETHRGMSDALSIAITAAAGHHTALVAVSGMSPPDVPDCWLDASSRVDLLTVRLCDAVIFHTGSGSA